MSFSVSQVVFAANFGHDNEDSIIAIDDLNWKKEPCPLPANCDFEGGLCDWKNDRVTAPWQLNQGSTPTENTGPDTDHTTDTNVGQL